MIQAADRFHVPPWELLGQGKVWLEMALATLNAERQAAHEIRRRDERRAKAARRRGRGGQ